MNVAVIPARGGSKRIPRKNIKEFHGKPLIAYSIEAAIESGCFDKVIVSTDDEEIAEIAKQYGAEIPFMRPADIADDFATTMDVMSHAISFLDEKQSPIKYVCCIYATAPLINSKDLIKGLELLNRNPVEFVFSATSFPFPVQRALTVDRELNVDMLLAEHENTRSQDLIETYHDAGQFYWGKKTAFLERKSIFSKHSKVVLLPRKQVQDIDTLEDWEMAEALYLIINKK